VYLQTFFFHLTIFPVTAASQLTSRWVLLVAEAFLPGPFRSHSLVHLTDVASVMSGIHSSRILCSALSSPTQITIYAVGLTFFTHPLQDRSPELPAYCCRAALRQPFWTIFPAWPPPQTCENPFDPVCP